MRGFKKWKDAQLFCSDVNASIFLVSFNAVTNQHLMHLRLMRTKFENPIPALLKKCIWKMCRFLRGVPHCKGNLFCFLSFSKGKFLFVYSVKEFPKIPRHFGVVDPSEARTAFISFTLQKNRIENEYIFWFGWIIKTFLLALMTLNNTEQNVLLRAKQYQRDPSIGQ